MARPPKPIDQRQFETLCALQCTEVEICNVLGVTVKPLLRWCKQTYGVGFKEIYTEKSAGGRASLRRMQFKSAEAGNVSMQIWLGKQWLNQSEKPNSPVEQDEIISDEVEALLSELEME